MTTQKITPFLYYIKNMASQGLPLEKTRIIENYNNWQKNDDLDITPDFDFDRLAKFSIYDGTVNDEQGITIFDINEALFQNSIDRLIISEATPNDYNGLNISNEYKDKLKYLSSRIDVEIKNDALSDFQLAFSEKGFEFDLSKEQQEKLVKYYVAAKRLEMVNDDIEKASEILSTSYPGGNNRERINVVITNNINDNYHDPRGSANPINGIRIQPDSFFSSIRGDTLLHELAHMEDFSSETLDEYQAGDLSFQNLSSEDKTLLQKDMDVLIANNNLAKKLGFSHFVYSDGEHKNLKEYWAHLREYNEARYQYIDTSSFEKAELNESLLIVKKIYGDKPEHKLIEEMNNTHFYIEGYAFNQKENLQSGITIDPLLKNFEKFINSPYPHVQKSASSRLWKVLNDNKLLGDNEEYIYQVINRFPDNPNVVLSLLNQNDISHRVRLLLLDRLSIKFPENDEIQAALIEFSRTISDTDTASNIRQRILDSNPYSQRVISAYANQFDSLYENHFIHFSEKYSHLPIIGVELAQTGFYKADIETMKSLLESYSYHPMVVKNLFENPLLSNLSKDEQFSLLSSVLNNFDSPTEKEVFISNLDLAVFSGQARADCFSLVLSNAETVKSQKAAIVMYDDLINSFTPDERVNSFIPELLKLGENNIEVGYLLIQIINQDLNQRPSEENRLNVMAKVYNAHSTNLDAQSSLKLGLMLIELIGKPNNIIIGYGNSLNNEHANRLDSRLALLERIVSNNSQNDQVLVAAEKAIVNWKVYIKKSSIEDAVKSRFQKSLDSAWQVIQTHKQ